MRRAFFLCTRTLRLSSSVKSNINPIPHSYQFDYIPKFPILAFPSSNFSFSSSSGNDSTIENPAAATIDNDPALRPETQLVDVEDVDNKEEVLLEVTGKDEQTHDNLIDELSMEPLNDVKDVEFKSETKSASDQFLNRDDRKWDDIVKEATDKGLLADMREREEILEDMISCDKLLPDKIKKKIEAKFDEIGERVEKGELKVTKGYELFKEFEDQMVEECKDSVDAEGPPQFNETNVPDKKKKKKEEDDPPGEGPILRWHTQVVMAPGGDARHPKNRKVKMSVTVKELGLSKHQFLRLRELVGKRYHPEEDELIIISERFEHREENRKDCLRTLLSLIEEAGKADKLVMDALTSHLKEKLKSNPHFMMRLNAKKTGIPTGNSDEYDAEFLRYFEDDDTFSDSD